MEIRKATQDVILKKINSNYRKTLLIDFRDGTFKVGDLPNDEKEALKDTEINTIKEYWKWFCGSDLLDDCSRKVCKNYEPQPNSRLFYRRKIDGEFHVMLMEIHSLEENPDYSLLTVRDINGIYEDEYNAVVDKIGTRDSFTGLLNRVAYERDKASHKDEKVGIIFADLNGLKYTNDKYGHKAGDALILKFASLLSINFGDDYECYHLSGDEFLVCAYNKPLREFLIKALAFHKSIWCAMDVPMASVGYGIGETGEFDLAYDDAEKAMYADKNIFKLRYPEYARK